MIGLMVGLLLAGLLGWYFISRRTGGNLTPATAPTATPDTGLKTSPSYGGVTFITQQGDASKAAANAGAYTYDQSTTQSAQLRAGAVFVATRTNDLNTQAADAYNADHGTNLTPDEYAAMAATLKLQSDAAIASAEAANGGGFIYNPTAGVVPTSTTNAQPVARRGIGHFGTASATPPTGPTGPQPPGTYWDYVSNGWKPLLA